MSGFSYMYAAGTKEGKENKVANEWDLATNIVDRSILSNHHKINSCSILGLKVSMMQ